MPRLKAPADLPELVKAAFANARRDGDIHYFPTQVTVFTAGTIPFQLRFSPALANKPKGPPPSTTSPAKPFDPFANPPPALRITDVGPSHFLVLNKFAVVPEHFILATADFKPQTHVLEEADLEATRACIAAYEADMKNDAHNQEGLFAFFNSGEHSGASQPHRHIQLLSISRMRDDLDATSEWSVMANHLDTHRAPFATFSEKISLEMEPRDLHAAYLRLYKRASRAVSVFEKAPHTQPAAETGEAPFSYNMAMTSTTLALAPRLAEGAKITAPDGHVLGNLALNGTVLAGTALVKSELEWEALQKDADGFVNVLRNIGIPSDAIMEDDIKL